MEEKCTSAVVLLSLKCGMVWLMQLPREGYLVPSSTGESISLIEAKQILSPWSDGNSWFGSNYHMNVYRGCSHGCIYCDSRSDCYRIEDFDQVRAKANVLEPLATELRSKRRKGIVATGAMSDPYNPWEERLGLTRSALELFQKHGFGASLLTKSDLIVRDIDTLLKIKEHSPAVAKLTITTYDDELAEKLERRTAVPSSSQPHPFPSMQCSCPG